MSSVEERGRANACQFAPAHAGSEDGGTDSPFAKHLRDDKITVIDLCFLRPRYFDWDFLSDGLRQRLVAVEAYVAIPDVQHSTPLNPVPRGE